MANARSQRLSNLCRFGAAHSTRSLNWSIVDLLLAWHLHTVLGLSGIQTGWIMFAFLAVGGAATFLVGLFLGKRGATGREVVTIQLPAAIAAGGLVVLQFHVDSPVAVVSVGLAFRIAYAVQDVAQNMLSSMLPTNEADIDRYARLRVTLSAVTRCCVATGFVLLTSAGTLAMQMLIALAMIASAASLRKLVFPAGPCIGTTRNDRRSTSAGLPSLLFAWLVAAMVLPTLQRLLIFTPAVNGFSGSGAWLLGGFCLGSVIGPLIRDVVDRRIVLAMIVVSGVAMVVPAPLATSGGWWRVAGAVVHGIAVSLVGVRLWATTSRMAIMARGAGRNNDGTVFGSVILTIHLASAGGMLLLGPLIGGFEAGHQGVALTALALTILGALMLAGIGVSERTAPATA